MRGGDPMNMFFGGFPGGGASFTFTTMGPGGRTTYYSSNGGRRMNGDHQNIEDERRRRAQQGPQSLGDYCINMCKQCLYMMFMMNLFLGIGPGYFISLFSYYLSNDSNIDRWDYSMKSTNIHIHEIKTDNFGSRFYLNQKEFTKFNKMKNDEPEMYKSFNKNMESHFYKETKRECSEAQFEQKRLRQKARYFNHRPEKAQEILTAAETLSQLQYCEEL